MPGISRRNNQYLNWMWPAYRSLDSSRQCYGVVKTVEWLSGLAPGLRQSNDSQHTLHELRARRLSKTHRTVDLQSTKSDVKVSQNRGRVLKHSGSHVTSSHTVVNRSTQPKKLGRHGSDAAGWRAQLRRAAYGYTGTIHGWYEEARIYANQRQHWVNEWAVS